MNEYNKTNWVQDVTPVSPTNMNKIEAGIDNVTDEVIILNSDKIFKTTGGSATAITITIASALSNGYPITFVASANNNGTTTTINGKPLYKPGGTIAPTLIAGKAYTVWYNTAGDCFFISASAEGDAVAADVLAGKKFSNDIDTGIVGTLALTGDATNSDVISGKTFYSTDSKSKQTGNLILTGTAAVGDVISGKSFYNTDAKSIQSGTGTNAKRTAYGTATSSTSSSYQKISVTGLSFQPRAILAYISNGNFNANIMPTNASANGSWKNFYTAYNGSYHYPSSTASIGTGNDQFRLTSNGFDMILGFNVDGLIGLINTVNWIAFE